MVMTKTIKLCVAFIMLSLACEAQVLTTVRQYVMGKDPEVWDETQYSMVATFAGLNEISDLSIFIEADGFKIPVYILKKDMNAEKRFLDMNLHPGDTVRIIGRGSMIRIGKERFKGLIDATILREMVVRESLSFESQITPDQEIHHTRPTFRGGGADEFAIWVNKHLRYPRIAKENGVQGRVITQFTIDDEGWMTNVRVLRGVDESLDQEALRVIRMSPRWEPALQEGKPVSVTFTFPVIFSLGF